MKRISELSMTIMVVIGTASLTACAPMLTGQMAEAGYKAAVGKLGGGSDLSSVGADERQKRIQGILNEATIGQDVQPLIDAMGEAPKEKTANMNGYVCYEYPAVYSSTEAAVIVSKESKVVFFGNSRCNVQMRTQADE